MPVDDWGVRPLLLAVETDPRRLGRTETELARSFAGTYRVRGEASVLDARRQLEGASQRGERVALLLVDDRIPAEEREELLNLARTAHPEARRGLLVDWGAWADQDVARTILRGTAVGDLHSYVLRPWTEGDELFHRTIAEIVQDWSRADPRNKREVVVVADPHSGRAFEVSNLLQRNRVPYAFRDRSSPQGQRVLEAAEPEREGEVVVWMPAIGGPTLVDPSDTEVLRAWGIPTELDGPERDFDAAVLGISGDLGLGHLTSLAETAGLRAPDDPAAAQRFFADSVPVAFLYHAAGLQGANRRVQGVEMDLRGELPSVQHWWVEP